MSDSRFGKARCLCMGCRGAIRLAAVLSVFCWLVTCSGAPDSIPNAPLRYRFVYIPESITPQEARGYRAIHREVFEEKLAAIEAYSGPASTTQAQIIDGAYQARFDGRRLLTGDAEFTVKHRSQNRTLLSLQDCNLAIDAARWRASASASEDPAEPAVVGVDPSGQRVVVTEQHGVLLLDWDLRGRPLDEEEIEFSLRLPRALTSSLSLELPPDWVPLVDAGLISGPTPLDTAAPAREADSNEDPPDDDDPQRWKILFGTQNHATLTLVTRQALERRRQSILLRQHSNYEFEDGGVNVTAEWNLDVKNVPLPRLVIERPPNLDILSATLGENEVRLTNVSPTEVVLDFEKPILGTNSMLQIRGFTRFESGKLWDLPTLHPQGVFWQEGAATLSLPPSLVVQNLEVEQGHQIGSEPQPDGGESHRFRLYRPDAGIRLYLERRPPEVAVVSGTTIRYGSERITAQVRSRFEATWGETFELEAFIPEPWLVESIETIPAEALDESALSLNLENRRLAIPLRDSIRPGHPITVVITAERQLPRGVGNETLTGRQLRAVQFPRIDRENSYFSVEGVISNDAFARRLNPATLTVDERELMNTATGRIILTDTPFFDRVTVAPDSQRPGYSAALEVSADVGDELRERYQLTITPENLPVSVVLVHFSHSRVEPPQWSISDRGKSVSLTARPLDESTKTNLGIRGGETWEISLPSQERPFTLLAERASPWHAKGTISLISLPNASTQRGTLTIRAQRGHFRIEAGPLQPIPTPPPTVGQYSRLLARYRYNPAKSAAPWLSQVEDPAGRREIWASSAHIHSWFESSGEAYHQVHYWLENRGASRLSLLMPKQAQDVHVLLDGEPVRGLSATATSDAFTVALPDGRQFMTVSVHYRTASTHLAQAWWQAEIQAPLPALNIPVLNRHWHFRVPSTFRVAGANRAQRTMVQKLFGNQVRWGNEGVFNAFRPEDWNQTVEGKDSEAILAADQFATALGRALENSAEPRWDQVLRDMNVDPTFRHKLFLDHAILAREGIRPTDRVPRPQTPSPSTEKGYRKAGWQAIRNAKLVVLVEAESLVLTSFPRLAEWEVSPEGRGEAPVFVVDHAVANNRSLRNWIAHNASLLPPDQWLLVAGPTAWEAPPQKSTALRENSGWQSYHRELGASEADESTVRIVVERESVFYVLSWGLLWMATGAVAWIVRRRSLTFLLVIAFAAALCMLAPPAYVPLARGGFWGSLLGWLVGILWSSAVRPFPSAPPTSTSDRSGSAISVPLKAGAILLLCGIGMSSAGQAQDADESASATEQADLSRSAPVHPVLVSVDEERQPVGRYYYVTRDFYHELHRRAADAKSMPQGWLIRSAQYQATASWDSQPLELEFSRITARYEIETFAAQRRVALPLDKNQVIVFEAFLNDQPAEVQWSADGTALEFDLNPSRSSTIELVLQPILETADDTHGFQFDVPAVPSAQLRLNAPEGMEDVLTIGSQGGIGRRTEMEPLQANLGPVETLSVHWPAKPASSAEPPQTLVSESLWMHVRPGSVVVDVRLQLALAESNRRPLRISVDPQLRLVAASVGDDEPQTVTPNVETGRLNQIEIPLPEEFEDVVTVELSFLLRNHSGFGNLRLPELKIALPRNRSRRFAISVAPGIELRETQNSAEPSWEKLAVADFTVAWGGNNDLPVRAMRLPAGAVDLGLSAQLASHELAASQITEVFVSQRSMDVVFQAELQSEADVYHQLELQVPPDLQVESVTASNDQGKPLAARVARNLDGELHLFLERPAPENWKLILRGRIPWGPPTSPPVPILTVRDANVHAHQLLVYRRPDIRDLVARNLEQLEVVPREAEQPEVAKNAPTKVRPLGRAAPAGDDPERSATNVRIEDRSRLALELTAPDPVRISQASATLTVRPNRTRTHARSVTIMSREGTSWQARFLCQLQVTGGVVDLLRFEIPATWQEPFTISPAADYEIRDIPGQNRRQLVIWPTEAIRRDALLRISAPLHRKGTTIRQAPDIELLDADVLLRFLVVPRKVESQQISWDTISLQAVRQLPDPFDQDFQSEKQEAYQVLGRKRFQATIRNIEPISGFPQVRLADVHLRWTVDERCFGQASFDLEPAAVESCRIVVPAQQRLLSATVGGLPAQLEPAPPSDHGEEIWVLRLGSVQLPQRILLTFEGRLPPPTALPDKPSGREKHAMPRQEPRIRRNFAAPRLENLPVARSLWTVEGPERAGPGVPLVADSEVDSLRQELFRIDAYATLIDLATESVATRPTPEVEHWYQAWIARFGAKRQVVSRLADSMGEAERARLLHRLETLTIDQEAIAEQLRTGRLFRRYLHQGTGELQWLDDAHIHHSQAVPVRCMFPGAAPEAAISYSEQPLPRTAASASPWHGPRTAYSLLALLAVMALLTSIFLVGAVREWLIQWPGTAVTLAGCLWWLTMTPSVWGFFAMAAGILLSLTSGWQVRKSRRSFGT